MLNWVEHEKSFITSGPNEAAREPPHQNQNFWPSSTWFLIMMYSLGETFFLNFAAVNFIVCLFFSIFKINLWISGWFYCKDYSSCILNLNRLNTCTYEHNHQKTWILFPWLPCYYHIFYNWSDQSHLDRNWEGTLYRFVGQGFCIHQWGKYLQINKYIWGRHKIYLKGLMLYLHEKFNRDISLQASHHVYVTVNDRKKPSKISWSLI